MKRLSLLMIAMVVLVAFTVPSFANMVTDKASGGAKQILNSGNEIYGTIETETKAAKFAPFGFAGGSLKSVFYVVKNIVAGTVNILTSPLEALKK